MFRSSFTQHLICSILIVATSAAFSSYNPGCNGSVAFGTAPGVSTTVTIPVDLTCDMAVLRFPDQEPIDLDIDQACNTTHAREQTFEIQLSDASPLGESRIMFLCGDLSDTFCVRLNLMKPTTDLSRNSRFTSNSVRSVCSGSGPVIAPSASPMSPVASSSLQLSHSANYTAVPAPSWSGSSSAVAALPQGGSMIASTISPAQSIYATSPPGGGAASLFGTDAASFYPSGTLSVYRSGVAPTESLLSATTQPPPAESSSYSGISTTLVPLPGSAHSISNVGAGQSAMTSASPGGCTCAGG